MIYSPRSDLFINNQPSSEVERVKKKRASDPMLYATYRTSSDDELRITMVLLHSLVFSPQLSISCLDTALSMYVNFSRTSSITICKSNASVHLKGIDDGVYRR